MSIRHAVEYCILYRDAPGAPLREKPVFGYPISLPVAGSYAIRRVVSLGNSEVWKIDHLESGCQVVAGSSRDHAITSALRALRRHGTERWLKALNAAFAKRIEAGLPERQSVVADGLEVVEC
jgi:hypothetical protein